MNERPLFPPDVRQGRISQDPPLEPGLRDIELPWFISAFDREARYKAAHGGRGSGKSWSVARKLLLRALAKRERILCTRELQVSIKDSVHRLLSDQTAAMQVAGHFDIQRNTITVPGNGSEFLFKGLRHNIKEIKSMEGITLCWVEEAQAVSEESWEVLVPTIREEGSEIWVTFNPDLEEDPTTQRFLRNPPPGSVIVEANWRDNPWFPQVLDEERRWMLRTDPDAYENVWEGKPRKASSAQVLRGKWGVDAFDPLPSWQGPYYGVDWGFSDDPTALVECYIDAQQWDLYVHREVWGLHIELNDLGPVFRRGMPGVERYKVRADNARPETISHVRSHPQGLPNLVAAVKGQGSVEDGIAFLRGFRRIVLHERCKHTVDEAKRWSYKVDKLTGDPLPELVDKHNHCWDGIRYALEPLIKRRGAGGYAGALGRTV